MTRFETEFPITFHKKRLVIQKKDWSGGESNLRPPAPTPGPGKVPTELPLVYYTYTIRFRPGNRTTPQREIQNLQFLTKNCLREK